MAKNLYMAMLIMMTNEQNMSMCPPFQVFMQNDANRDVIEL